MLVAGLGSVRFVKNCDLGKITYIYYMALSHKDWELRNSRILDWLKWIPYYMKFSRHVNFANFAIQKNREI